MEDITYDELGPARVVQLYDPQCGLKAFVVVDNVCLGPAIGGVRVSPSVSALEVARLARAMTLKNASAGLDHGGGKAGIVADPKRADLEQLFRSFARLIANLSDYIPGPDMGSDEQAMVWIHEENGRSVGLPGELGGLPLDVLGATGFGLAACAEVAAQEIGLELAGARVAIQGYGHVGAAAARFLAERGAVIVAASDRTGTFYDPRGHDPKQLDLIKKDPGAFCHATGDDRLPVDALFGLPCDILIPAAGPDVITMNNQEQVQAKLILQGANIPITADAESALAQRGVLVVPDFIANAGGVIMAAMEYQRQDARSAFAAIDEKIRHNTEQILNKSRKEQILPRAAADRLARERLLTAMGYRSWSHPWHF